MFVFNSVAAFPAWNKWPRFEPLSVASVNTREELGAALNMLEGDAHMH